MTQMSEWHSPADRMWIGWSLLWAIACEILCGHRHRDQMPLHHRVVGITPRPV
jgi:hypothetical protein